MKSSSRSSILVMSVRNREQPVNNARTSSIALQSGESVRKTAREQTHTENMSTLSPFGNMSPSILSITMSFDEEATRCSPMVYGDGSASCRI